MLNPFNQHLTYCELQPNYIITQTTKCKGKKETLTEEVIEPKENLSAID